MSSNSNATVTTVSLKVLEITEQGDSGAQCPVKVKLRKGDLIGTIDGTAIYKGKMTYNNGSKNSKVDMIEATFSDDQGGATEQGDVPLTIKLKGGNTFKSDTSPVTSLPNDPTSVPEHCITIGSVSDCGSTIEITFQEPQEGEYVAYPALYFHTDEGVIDPAVTIRRVPV